MRSSDRLLGVGLLLLAATVATVALLGPLVFDVLRYRISTTSLNQIIGADAAALTVVVPVTVAVAVLAIRGRPRYAADPEPGNRSTRCWARTP